MLLKRESIERDNVALGTKILSWSMGTVDIKDVVEFNLSFN